MKAKYRNKIDRNKEQVPIEYEEDLTLSILAALLCKTIDKSKRQTKPAIHTTQQKEG